MPSSFPVESRSVCNISPPFDYFKFIEDQFNPHTPIERIFSLATSYPDQPAQTLLKEELDLNDRLRLEVEELENLYDDYQLVDALRYSFWIPKVDNVKNISALNSDQLLGYAILLHEIVPEDGVDRWHVYEAVFRNYPHEHNYIPRNTTHSVEICDSEFEIDGELYCQQNDLNKTCAHVALETLLSKNMIDVSPPSYSDLNEIIRRDSNHNPMDGLGPQQFRLILDELGFNYFDIDFEQNPSLRNKIPYQRIIYSGMESGFGTLLGFDLDRQADDVRHIIPVFGHTFNKDTFVPNAELSYFKVGPDTRYHPSENWMSSFIGHDDNFGPNYCIPRNYLPKENVDYVLTILPNKVKENALRAELYGLEVYYDLLTYIEKNLSTESNRWIERIQRRYKAQDFVLRTINVSLEEYIEYLRTTEDVESNSERLDVVELVEEIQSVCERGWLVEVSIPNLFSAEKKKVGEIIINAEQSLDLRDPSSKFEPFLLARMLGQYYFSESDREGTRFLVEQGNLNSPTDLFGL